MKLSTKETLRIYWQHLSKYKGRFYIATVFWVLGLLTILAAPLLYKRFFDIIAGDVIVGDIYSQLVGILLAILGLAVIGRVFFNLSEWHVIHLTTKIISDLANTCFQYLHKHSYSFFTGNFVGSLVKRVNRFYRGYDHIFGKFFWSGIPIVINIIGPAIVLLFIAPGVSLILLVWSIIFMIVVYKIVRYKLRYDIPRAEADSRVTGVLADTITNFMNVKLFTAHKREFNYFNKELRIREDLHRKGWIVGFHMHWIQGSLMILVEFISMMYGLWLWSKGILTAGDLVLIQAYVARIVMQLWDFSHIVRDVYESMADAEEMTEIFMTPHELIDVHGAKALNVTAGEVKFENVSFSYHKTRRVLHKLDLVIKPGEKVALVGPSGAGKSTIVKLLFRYFDVETGKLLIDGQKLASVKQESVFKNVSLVPQDPILFHRSLIDNIRYGNPKATDADVVKASKLAHAHEFIKELPDGYNTFVGERGIKLSGGERQRVAIARAIIKNAPILVLDEATSSLDSESEKLIQDALQKLMKGRTTIVIAHRLSTIMKMDRILVMQKGRVVEDGTHQALTKKKGGLYKKLWELQAGGFLGE